MPDLLIEIGTEELPTDALDVVYAELKMRAEKILRQNRLEPAAIKVEATPRRIALFAEGMAGRQPDQTLEILGPSAEKAYDTDGKPTAALIGFLKSKGAALEEISVEDRPKGKTVVLKKLEKGKPAAAVLPRIMGEVFGGLPFPKTMRWDATGFRFPRPVRWLVFLLDGRVVPFRMGNVRSSDRSHGHRFLAPNAVSIPRADWQRYRAALRRAHVWLGLEERKACVRNTLANRFKQKEPDEGLIHTAAQLVEEPFFLEGRFDRDYLRLPAEVLATCMRKNQKIFALYGSGGRLSGKFLAVLNGRRRNLARVRADYENVLESRLRDARYFYEADTRRSLEDRRAALEQITYLGKLGSMLQKSERLEKLADLFSERTGNSPLAHDLKRVARLAKCDLMTQMVFEFPDLQGTVGGEYARVSGESADVVKAISLQYLPKNLGEDYRLLRSSFNLTGALFGILDRFDLLTGAFGTGLEPTGSQDPFALRRAGGCLIKLIRAFRPRFSLAETVASCASLYGGSLDKSAREISDRLGAFLQERAVFELQVRPGTRACEIFSAVCASGFDDMADAFDRFEILTSLYENDRQEFLKTCKVVERTGNITRGTGALAGEVRPELFSDPLEGELHRLTQEHSGEITGLIERREYEKATRRYGQIFYAALHEFFGKVMVNAEDAAIRANRHALMKRINFLYTGRLADLSVLSRIDQE